MNKLISTNGKAHHKPYGLFNLFDDVFGKDMERFIGSDQKHTVPAVNISKTEAAYKVEVAAPGFDKKDFDLSVDDNQLTLTATKEVSEKEEKPNYSRREFSYGTFTRTFTLPEDADTENIVANYNNGILALNIPVLEPQKKELKKIKVK